MKNLKIIALVIAAHVAGLAVLLSVQGCRSTTASADKNAVASDEPVVPVAPVAASRTQPPLFQPIAINVPGASTQAPATPPPDRYAPTRPGSAAAAESLPAQSYVVKKNDTIGAIARKHGVTKDDLSRANNLGKSATLQIGQKLVIPSPKPAGGAADGSVGPAGLEGPTYKVRSGDTLGAIAKRHGVSTAALRAANGLTGDAIGVGQELHIPGGAKTATPSTTTPPANGTGLNTIGTPPADPNAATKPKTPPAAGRGAGRHQVALGETIGMIAKRYKVSEVSIMTANNITNAKSIRPGQELIIPGAAGLAAPPQPAVEADPATLVPSGEAPPVQPVGSGDTPVQPVEEAPPVVPVH